MVGLFHRDSVPAVDPDFQRMLIRVAIVGGLIGVIGVIVLIFAIRGFRGDKHSPFSGPLLVVVLLAFVMICCYLLLRVSLE
jgi:hypothetical protein